MYIVQYTGTHGGSGDTVDGGSPCGSGNTMYNIQEYMVVHGSGGNRDTVDVRGW